MNVGRIRLVAGRRSDARHRRRAVAVSGLIGFLGIIVPHFVRLVAGRSYRIVLPLSLLVGGGFLAFADVLARTVALAGGAADRRGHRLLRRAVLRDRAADAQERRPVTALALAALSVDGRTASLILDGVSGSVERGGVGDA